MRFKLGDYIAIIAFNAMGILTGYYGAVAVVDSALVMAVLT